jgi:hypothetical protein
VLLSIISCHSTCMFCHAMCRAMLHHVMSFVAHQQVHHDDCHDNHKGKEEGQRERFVRHDGLVWVRVGHRVEEETRKLELAHHHHGRLQRREERVGKDGLRIKTGILSICLFSSLSPFSFSTSFFRSFSLSLFYSLLSLPLSLSLL